MGARQERIAEMNHNATRRVLGGVCLALGSAMSKEAVEKFADTLYQFAENPIGDDEDRYIYQTIANSLVGDVDELAAETERLERGRRFSVITGGAA
jgi:hypothetical protein